MIHATLHLPAPTLGHRVSLTALLPEQGDGPFPTLYLLHGLTDDHTIWTRLTSLERYAWRYPMAIVMPQGFRGFYTTNDAGPDYVKYLMEDVVAGCERVLPLRRDRAGRAIGGLSMGGYGALRVGLAHAEAFASIASHSGAVGYGAAPRREGSPLGDVEHRQIFGDASPGGPHDLVALARGVTSPPRIAIDCGVDDFLLDQNRALHAAFPLPHDYVEHPGAHTWDYWDARLPTALAFHAAAMGVESA